MDTSFFPILSATTAKITATATEWKALLRFLPPDEEVLPLFKKIADGARFFTYIGLLGDYRGARLAIECSVFHRHVGGTCVFNVGQRAALTFVISAHQKELTTPQKNMVSRVLLKAKEICDPVNDLLYDLAINMDKVRADDIRLDALMSAQQLSIDITEFQRRSND